MDKPRPLLSYHLVWLVAHPNRDEAWLRERLREGFDVHHLDGNKENEAPGNLALMEHLDHMRLHGSPMKKGRLSFAESRTYKKIKKKKGKKKAVSQQILFTISEVLNYKPLNDTDRAKLHDLRSKLSHESLSSIYVWRVDELYRLEVSLYGMWQALEDQLKEACSRLDLILEAMELEKLSEMERQSRLRAYL